MSSDAKARRKRVALVIGAGSVKCAAALGLWKTLAKHDIELDLLVGCSGGSMYAALMALGYDIDTCERMTRELWTRKITSRRDVRSMLGGFLPGLFRFDGNFATIHDGPLNAALRHGFEHRRFDEAKIPLHVVTTDFATGQKVVVSEGEVFDAIRASVAIPYVWKPWRVGDRMLFDGCVSDPLPVDVAIREGAHIILAMGFESPYPRKVKSASRYAFHVSSIYTNNLLRANYSFHNLAHHAEIIPILPEFNRQIGLFDTDAIPYAIEEGARAAEEQIPYLKRLIDAIHV